MTAVSQKKYTLEEYFDISVEKIYKKVIFPEKPDVVEDEIVL